MKNYLLLVLFLLGVISCTQDDVSQEASRVTGKDQLTVTFENLESRLGLQDESLVWNANDQIVVHSETEEKVFTIQEGVGTNTAQFMGNLPKNPTVVSLKNGFRTPTFITHFLLVKIPETIPAVNDCKLPMWATWEGTNVSLKHLMGILAVPVKGIPAKFNQLIITSSTNIYGSYEADLSASEVILVPNTENKYSDNKKLTFDYGELIESDDDVIYMPLPVATYASLKVSVSDGSEELVLKEWKDLEVKRAGLYQAGYRSYVVEGETPDEVSNSLENDLVGDNVSDSKEPEQYAQVDLAGQIVADENPIVIPDEVGELYTNVILNFMQSPVTSITQPLKIEQNADAEVGESNTGLTLQMPHDAIIENVDILAPRTSVTLNGGMYRKLTVTSALNTTIIGSDVTVDNLVVRGGNVRILNGGRITGTISKAAECTSQVYIILEEGMNVEDALPGNFMSGNDGVMAVYESEYAFRQQLEQSAQFMLTDNVELLNPIKLTKSFDLELNGKNINSRSSDVFEVLQGGKLLLIDADNTGWVTSPDGHNVISVKGGNVCIQGGIYKGTIEVTGNKEALEIVGGIFKGFDPSPYVDPQFTVRLLEGTTDEYEVITADWMEVSEGVYEIFTAKGMREFASMVENGDTFEGKVVRLGTTINMNNELWTPMGTVDLPFKGTFDGQGFAIKNLRIDSNERYVGLFAFANGATIKNLRIIDGEVKGGSETNYLGAFVGRAIGVVVINCHNVGCNILLECGTEGGFAGGLVGYAGKNETTSSVVLACSNTATIRSDYAPSGIVGGGYGAGTHIVACYNLGDIVCKDAVRMFASGIVANFGGGSNFMSGCFTDCTIPAGETNGALVGDIGTNASNVHYSYAANSSIKLFGQIWSDHQHTVGYASYREAVPYLNKGIEYYNWTAKIPCEYTFVEGDTPSLVYTKPSSNSGIGGEDWGNGGKF